LASLGLAQDRAHFFEGGPGASQFQLPPFWIDVQNRLSLLHGTAFLEHYQCDAAPDFGSDHGALLGKQLTRGLDMIVDGDGLDGGQANRAQ
jgi:hypothetical protein